MLKQKVRSRMTIRRKVITRGSALHLHFNGGALDSHSASKRQIAAEASARPGDRGEISPRLSR
jgi:hypothetical protein